MGWFAGCVLFALLWWTALFAVLPFVSRPDPDPDPVSGVRGTQRGPFAIRAILLTTLVTASLWVACFWLVDGDVLSFRHGLFEMHGHCASDPRFCS